MNEDQPEPEEQTRTRKGRGIFKAPVSTSTNPKPLETTVLLVQGFPTSYKTIDILELFKPQTPKIKWIDDTSCYAIFINPLEAKRAYISSSNNPIVSISASQLPKSKERYSRPATTDLVARRMIAGALGMRAPKKTEQELNIENEKFSRVRGEFVN